MCIFQQVRVTFGKTDPYALRDAARKSMARVGEGGQTVYHIRNISYIATADEYGQWFEFKVLASNARDYEPAGRYRDITAGKKAVEAKYGKVTWVTPYRFRKELTAI